MKNLVISILIAVVIGSFVATIKYYITLAEENRHQQRTDPDRSLYSNPKEEGLHKDKVNSGFEDDDADRTSGNVSEVTATSPAPSKTRDPIYDFTTYPCLPGVPKSTKHPCVRTVNVTSLAMTVPRSDCVGLHLQTPTQICIHDPRKDRIVSASVFARGIWEGELVNQFIGAIQHFPDIVVLDVGCNIGVYTLAAAKAGKRVVSIDANVENLRLLSKSLTLGTLTNNVTLIWNAVSDIRSAFILRINSRNVGASFIDPNNSTVSGNDVTVQTVFLDDIRYLFEDRPVAIKMDVEHFELRVIKGGLVFLKHVTVKFIQIEIFHPLRRQEISMILNPMGFKPFVNCLGETSLVHINFNKWPNDACFIKLTL